MDMAWIKQQPKTKKTIQTKTREDKKALKGSHPHTKKKQKNNEKHIQTEYNMKNKSLKNFSILKKTITPRNKIHPEKGEKKSNRKTETEGNIKPKKS